MPHFKICLTASLLLLLCACHDKPAPEPQADSPPDPKMQALLNTPVSDINEDTVNDFLSEDSGTEPANEESEPAPEHLTEPEAQYQEEFELKVYREETQSTMTGYIDKIDILSLNDQPTTIKSVTVNRGHCRVVSLYDHQNMHYGSVALAYPRCNAAHIREVSVSTGNGTSTYRLR